MSRSIDTRNDGILLAMTSVTPETFESEVVKAEKPVIVEFWAPWCGPCHTLKPLLQEFSETEKERVKVVLANAQDHPDLANRFGIMALPTFLAFRGGVITSQHVGSLKRERLAQLAGIA